MDRLLDSALACHRTGDFTTAGHLYDRILTENPHHADTLHLRGVLLHQAGDDQQAVRYIERALTLHPTNVIYLSNISLCYRALGRLEEALVCCRRAAELAPDTPYPMANLGLVLCECGRDEEAEHWLRQSLRLDPRQPQVYNSLGNLRYAQGQVPEAADLYREALRLDPQCAAASLNLGNTFRELGDFAAAEREYRRAIELAPRLAAAYYGLSAIKRYSPADIPEILRLESLLDDPRLSADDQISLHFAAGKMYDDCGMPDRAFQHFRQANQTRPLPFDRNAFCRDIQRRISLFSDDLFAAPHPVGSDSDLPIFIVGMPRSGTSLVEQIVASHPAVFGAGELKDLDQAAARLWGAATSSASPLGAGGRSAREALMATADDYLARCRSLGGDAAHVTDKMPGNFLHLGLVALLFPRAKVIHCRRDPLDACLSCYTTNFKNRQPHMFRLEDLGFYYRQYERLMDHWRRVLPLPILDVSYEELVASPEPLVRRLVAFCGLPWDDRCLQFHRSPRCVQTCSVWQVRQPIYSRSVGRWRAYARHLDPLVQALGTAPSASH